MTVQNHIPAALLMIAALAALAPPAHAALRREGSRPPLFSLPDTTGRTVSLRSFLGPRRVLLLFAPDPAYLKNVAAHRAQFEERNLTVLAVVSLDSPLVQGDHAPVHVLLDAEGTVAREYGAEQNRPAFFLIGKDGHIKMARHGAPTLPELFGTIDSMPMRQQEIRERAR